MSRFALVPLGQLRPHQPNVYGLVPLAGTRDYRAGWWRGYCESLFRWRMDHWAVFVAMVGARCGRDARDGFIAGFAHGTQAGGGWDRRN